MSDPFDWQIGEEDDELPPFEAHGEASRGYWVWSFLILLGAVAAASLVFGGYRTTTNRLEAVQDDVGAVIQAHLDVQGTAVKNGDGDLFFSLHEESPSWQAAQLLPLNQTFYQANPHVTRVQVQDEMIWANVTAQIDHQPVSRLMFFSRSGTELQQVATDRAFWGNDQTLATSWGELRYSDADEVWIDEVDHFVAETISHQCNVNCLANKRSFQLTLATDYGETAVDNHIRIPSPRLLALNNDGQPADLFWDALEAKIIQQITPATIRFGIPPAWFPLVDYENAAKEFMALHPDITVELVPLDSNDPEQADVTALDGATLFPTESMLASGQVRNLSTYLVTDESFDHSDFYSQLWRGAWWREQFWLVPQAGQMRMLYYDRTSYQAINQPEPSLRWTWDEMEQDMAHFAEADISPEWGFLDAGNDALFSYAYNLSNSCEEPDPLCDATLTTESIEETLTWYLSHSGKPGHMPDMTRIKLALPESVYDQEAHTVLLSNWQSAHRRSVIWVEDAKRFELMVLLGPMGVVPFPGSDRFDGITPVWVQGHIIFQHSERPLATWKWISYLSNQPLSSRFRYVPARSSVAIESEYWATLPRQLSEPMRTAVPFARPILIEEQHLFSWELLTAVIAGDLTPQQAANLNYQPNWFGSR